MANIFVGKFKSVCKLLSEENVVIFDEYVNDHLKCVICKKILINACQTDCGCNFCKKCIDEYQYTGGLCCPGDTKDCQYNKLSNIIVDYKTNRQISQLVVRCGYDNCNFSCELMNMEVHMETCLKKRVSCPFKIVGCEEKLKGDQVNDHFQLDICNHSKLLLDVITNLRNEVKELRENEKLNNDEISKLKDKVSEQMNDLKTIKENTDLIKMEMENKMKGMKNLENEMIDIINYKASKTFDQVNENMKALKVEINEDMKTVTEQVETFKTSIESLTETESRNKKDLKSWNETVTKNCDIVASMNKEMQLNKIEFENTKNKMKEIIEEVKKVMKSMKHIEMENITNDMHRKRGNNDNKMILKIKNNETPINKPGEPFGWHIGRIDMLENGRPYYSEYFYNRNNEYKMRLQLYLRINGQLGIYLLVYRSPNDEDLHWPLLADVTIRIINISDQNICKSISKGCAINQPKENLWQSSDIFEFEKFDLSKIGLNCPCSIECFIETCT